MGIARDLVELEDRLRGLGVDLFAPVEQGGLLDAAVANTVLRRVESFGFDDPMSVMRLCLQTLRVQHDEMAPRFLKAELVATLPPDVPGIARPTGQVLFEMLHQQAREAILLGYEFTDQKFLGLLAETASRGAEVIIICDRERGSARRIIEAWPKGVKRPRVFQDRERLDSALYASMHAKCLLVDGNDLLVTSANFTFHGLHGNIEIGIRLSGPPVAEARKIFSHLVDAQLVEEVHD